MASRSVQSLLFPLARRFVAGESTDEALTAVRALNASGMGATIDMLGEDVRTDADADRVCAGYRALIEQVAQAGARSNLSIKLSALGLQHAPDAAQTRFDAVLDAAQAALHDPIVRVDMEGSALAAATLRAVDTAFGRHTNTGPVLQAALLRTPADVRHAIERGMRVRLCKGAYKEPASIALQRAAAIRPQFLALATLLLEGGRYPAIATHDPLLIAAVQQIAGERRIARDAFEFQLLYGVRPDVQAALVRDGYRVRIYVPFGTRWARYFRRRITERRANLVFAISSLLAPAADSAKPKRDGFTERESTTSKRGHR